MNLLAPERRPRAARDPWEVVHAWLEEHGQVAVATVVSTWGSAPVPTGGQLVVAPGDRFEGSVSGGCVEVDVLVQAADVMTSGTPKLLEFGVSEETAWRAGLPCGGKIKVLVEPLTRNDIALVDAIVDARRERQTVVVTTRIGDGTRQLYESHDEMPAEIAGCLAAGTIGLIDAPGGEVFVQPLVPPLRIVVSGATHIGQIFAELARQVGYEVTVVDPRSVFATEERFGAVPAMTEWPQALFDKLGLDVRTAVVALTHASHIDDEALTAALRSPCLYIGALGSRATHAKRLERLVAAGFSPEELQRIHAPIGLAIGAKGPAEIAVSILAEIIKVARGAG
ncbi:MAG TPA: XdhC family protein [Hyphomicrobium sp.]